MSAVSSAALAEQVRAFIEDHWTMDVPGYYSFAGIVEENRGRAVAALDRLVALLDSERQAREKAERDAAIKDRAMTDYFADASRRADAAEAARDRLAEALQEIKRRRSQIFLDDYCESIIDSALAAAGSGGNTEDTT